MFNVKKSEYNSKILFNASFVLRQSFLEVLE